MTQPQHSRGVYVPPAIAAIALIPLIVFWSTDAAMPVAQVGIFLIALAALAFGFADMLVRDVRHTYRNTINERMIIIAVMVLETVALFAVTYLEISQLPGEIVGMRTVLDAVYFTMTTLMTIGFGDIAAEGQLARGAVLTQMLFTILVLSSSVRLLSTLVRTATEKAKAKLP